MSPPCLYLLQKPVDEQRINSPEPLFDLIHALS